MRGPRQRRTVRQVHDEHVERNFAAHRRGGRPKGTTRERVLDVALELFTENGYDKTSLREIAEVLGFTKAALYYHFEKKEDILFALHLRMHDLGNEAVRRLATVSPADADSEVWVSVIDEFIDQVLANRALFLFHVRNEKALEQIQRLEHNHEDHADMQEQMRLVLSNPAIPLPLRVRMACSIGAVMGALMGMGESFADVSADELVELVRDAVHDLMAIRFVPARRDAEPASKRLRPHEV